MKQEIQALKDQLTKAVSLIVSYEEKLESHVSLIDFLKEKIEFLVNDKLKTSDVTTLVATDRSDVATLVATERCDVAELVATVSSEPAHETLNPKQVVKNKTKSQKHKKSKQKNAQPTAPLSLCTQPEPEVIELGLSSSLEQSTLALATSVDAVDEVLKEPDSQWTVVTRKHRQMTSISGTAGPAVTTLKAVEPRKYLHLWNMESSADEIRNYLQHLCPEGSGTCTVDLLTSKGNYKSYKMVLYHLTITIHP
ncbi:hypothetical protein PYW08_015109 [Mythimna loreyi]|uniref:Uncharacterized protein n=1 Tax=Mythimna loreyi TaxID=667449 RepID=A0ACC2QV00_9NEOP|nr:hypothetical protein PYW08_015109 [Mythimna loreyi]